MPHECVDCGRVCGDGSSDVFEGCPGCGGTKFFYVREVTDEDEFQPAAEADEPPAEEDEDLAAEERDEDLAAEENTAAELEDSAAEPQGQTELDETVAETAEPDTAEAEVEPTAEAAASESEEPTPETNSDAVDVDKVEPSGGQQSLEEIAAKTSEAPETSADDSDMVEADVAPEARDAVEITTDGAEHSSQKQARAVTAGDDLDTEWPDLPGRGDEDGASGASGSNGGAVDGAGGAGEDADEIVEADAEYERTFGGKMTANGDSDGGDAGADAGTGDTADDDIIEATASEATASAPSTGAETIERDGKTYQRVQGQEARRELNAEFETIKIVEPGSYELNLMNLYDRDEKIIALQEDGRYQVSLPTFED